ncbi:TrmB family transcriptional regulator, partial [Halobellus sp. Atlit-38R]|uniref:helix-turn-helix domain-containing protein n=2 Tax=unclassified Halobellus TaxID=2638438 RepID=UPI000F1E973C
MEDVSNQDQAIELLQQLGLKEYEAKSFVALARRQRGTAKDISETSEVPRTR